MHDFLLSEALKRLATDAATRFAVLVAGGEQIPFDVAEESGEEAAFYSYVPLTARYVEQHAGELRTLPSFAAAREAAIEAGVAAGYLEARGEAVSEDPAERAERMLVVFIASLWDGCAEFSLDRERLEGALSVLAAEVRDADDADVLIAPLVGLRMTPRRLQLPSGVRVVRAETIEAPIEAMRSEGMGRAAWEPQFLAVAEQGGEGGTAAAMEQLRELVSVLRLFKDGGVGLGPYAFAPTGEGCWRRVATGAPASRPGGYRLSESEAESLAELAASLEARPDPDAALTWAVGRFEMGCERASALEGLSDHLLALRAVLEGHGPVGATLPMRAAALFAGDPHERDEARDMVEAALGLERALMAGERRDGALELAIWVEGGVRGLLRKAALGELGGDLSSIADETLIANGLAEGDAEIAVAAIDLAQPELPLDTPVRRGGTDSLEENDMDQETRIMEPIPAEDEIKITATPWLEEVSEPQAGVSLEWPALDGEMEAIERDVGRRERVDTPRVRHLFPVPDADWDVGELRYSRNVS